MGPEDESDPEPGRSQGALRAEFDIRTSTYGLQRPDGKFVKTGFGSAEEAAAAIPKPAAEASPKSEVKEATEAPPLRAANDTGTASYGLADPSGKLVRTGFQYEKDAEAAIQSSASVRLAADTAKVAKTTRPAFEPEYDIRTST